MTIRTLTTESGFLINEYQVNMEDAETLMKILILNKVRFEVTF
jgi:hypothetical protein